MSPLCYATAYTDDSKMIITLCILSANAARYPQSVLVIYCLSLSSQSFKGADHPNLQNYARVNCLIILAMD